MSTELLTAITPLLHSPVRNYVIPGLTSWLVGTPDINRGTVRMFESGRSTQEAICPHSHRFAFKCLVLAGHVTNRLWYGDAYGDEYETQKIVRSGPFGSYESADFTRGKMSWTDEVYQAGDWYSMRADEIHSITFSQGAKVLMFEGPEETAESLVLQPVVDGVTIPTFRTEPWMFQSDTDSPVATMPAPTSAPVPRERALCRFRLSLP